jgi:hypothetical protein
VNALSRGISEVIFEALDQIAQNDSTKRVIVVIHGVAFGDR